MKFFFVFSLLLISNKLLFSQFSFQGEGTEYEPYEIWTKEHLIEMDDSMHIAYENKNPRRYSNTYFCLMQDIEDSLSQTMVWIFWGKHFHCNRKKINVAIDSPHFIPSITASLFGSFASSLAIDGLIAEGYLIGNGGSGIVAGSSGTVSYCINNATIIGMNPNISFAGGIASDNHGTITNCLNNGSVTGVDRIGGIVSDNWGSVISCINTGKVVGSNSGNNGIFSGVAGIVATAQYGFVLNCINLGDIEGKDYVAGIHGLASGTSSEPVEITNCINAGYVKGNNIVSGILGIMWNRNVNISVCINTGVIEGEEDVGSIVGGEK